MKISKINDFFEKIGRFQVKNRIAFLIVLAAFTAFGLVGLKRFKLKIDDSSWIAGQDEVKKAQERYKEIFGNEQYIAVLVQADDVFNPEVLTAIDKLSKRLSLEVPFANQVTSLTTLSISRGTEDGVDVSNPFKKGIPGGGKPLSQLTDDEKKSLAEKKSFLMSRTSLVNTIVSDDCKETWVLLSLLPYKNANDDPYTISAAAIKIVESPEFQNNPAFTMKGVGTPYSTMEQEQVVHDETRIRIISGFAVMLLCLIFLVRSVSGVVTTVVASLLGIGMVFGFSGWLNIVGDEDFVTLPVMLSMALSIGYALHFINSFQLEQTRISDRKQSVIEAVKKTGWPILFTVLTTVASFISFVFSGIKPLIWLGGVSSAAVLAVYLYVVMLLPVIYSFGKDTPADGVQASDRQIKIQKKKNEMLLRTDEMYGKVGRFVLARKPECAVADGTDGLRKNQILALVGVDWNRDSWTVTAQVYEDAVLSYDDTLDRHEHEPGGTLHISRTFLADTLSVSASVSAGFADWDSYAGLSAEYSLTDQIKLGLDGNAYFPGPKAKGKFGKYKDLSGVTFTGTLRF